MRALTLAACLAAVSCAAPGESAPEMRKNGPIKYARFTVGSLIRYGIVEGDRVREISGDPFSAWVPLKRTHALSDVRLLPPTRPSKVLAVGLNYKSHLGDRPVPKVPEIFFKVPSALIAHGEPIVIPKGTTDCHYELEMVIVVGKRAANVPPERGLEYVLGVTCGNDVSARDWQKGDLQWWRAKGSDTFAPCGPFIVSGIDYDAIEMELRVNGTVRQKQTTADMVFNVGKIVSWISEHVTLEPGDLIYTGTPGKTEAMKPGDVVDVDLAGVGFLRNPVEAER